MSWCNWLVAFETRHKNKPLANHPTLEQSVSIIWSTTGKKQQVGSIAQNSSRSFMQDIVFLKINFRTKIAEWSEINDIVGSWVKGKGRLKDAKTHNCYWFVRLHTAIIGIFILRLLRTGRSRENSKLFMSLWVWVLVVNILIGVRYRFFFAIQTEIDNHKWWWWTLGSLLYTPHTLLCCVAQYNVLATFQYENFIRLRYNGRWSALRCFNQILHLVERR